MRFELTTDQQDFATALDALVAGSDPIGVARAWADGDTAPGLELWTRLAEQGVTMLATEAGPVEVCAAFEVLGRHAIPGPWVESAVYLPAATGVDLGPVCATVAVPPQVPYALDAHIAEQVYVAIDGRLRAATPGEPMTSVDRTRRLSVATPGDPVPHRDLAAAFDLAALATAAQLLGLGERVLADSVTYVKQRKQFGREIGSYQAVKHQLADVRIALDFARPLLYGAALDPTPRAVSAAKVQCADAAYLAARTGLQVHGAIGYTQEFGLSVFLTKIRALVSAWGTTGFHRARVLESLVGAR